VVREHNLGTSADTVVGLVEHTEKLSRSAGALNPSEVIFRSIRIDGLSPNTRYHARFEVFDAMVMTSATVHEGWQTTADDTVTGVCNPDKFHVEGPIYDEHAQDLTEANNKLWRHNGATLMSWTCDYNEDDSSVPRTTSTSYVDLIAESAGFYLNTQYRSTRRRTGSAGVPVEFAIRAARLSGAGTADFRLTDGTNNIDLTGVAISGTTTWFTGTATMSDTPATWRMQHRVSVGTTDLRTSGWAVWQYET